MSFKLLKGSLSIALCLNVAAPTQSYAWNECFAQPECVSTSGNTGNYTWAAAAAVLCGAAAGAGVGYAVGRDNKSCHKKQHHQSCCDTRKECKDDCLTFNISYTVNVGFNESVGDYSATFQYFVNTPNGCSILSAPETLAGAVTGPIVFNSITGPTYGTITTITTNACCGTYQAGILIDVTVDVPNNIELNDFGVVPNVIFITDCDGDTQYASIPDASAFVAEVSGVNAISNPFTYSGQFALPWAYTNCISKSCK